MKTFVLFEKKLVDYLYMCKRYKMKPMLNIINYGNKETLLAFDEVRIIPYDAGIIYFMYEHKKILEIKLSDIINCEYKDGGLFFNVYLK